MASTEIKEYFQIPSRMKTWAYSLMGIGILCLIIGFITKGNSSDVHEQSVFWGTLLYNCIFFTLICNAAMFFLSACTLAMGGWLTSFRRVPEAISSMVPVLGTITFIVMLIIVFGHKTYIYPWLDSSYMSGSEELHGKMGFLNPGFL